jgi:SAM-dependent methyltransferase
VTALARRLDPRRVLELPSMYRLLAALTRPRQASIFAREYVRARAGDRVLDIGSGPGDLLTELPRGIEYVGFDLSEPYVRAARARFGDRGTFFCRAVDGGVVDSLGAASFDLVVSHGVLHHLDDSQADEFFALARAALRPADWSRPTAATSPGSRGSHAISCRATGADTCAGKRHTGASPHATSVRSFPTSASTRRASRTP